MSGALSGFWFVRTLVRRFLSSSFLAGVFAMASLGVPS
jgi:hypothetical protein